MSQPDSVATEILQAVPLTSPTDDEVIAAGFELVPKDKEYFGENLKASVPFFVCLAKERLEVEALQAAIPAYPKRLPFNPSDEQEAAYRKGEEEFGDARERATDAEDALDAKVNEAWLALSSQAQMTLKARAFDLIWPEIFAGDVPCETMNIIQHLAGHARHASAIEATSKRARVEGAED